MSNSLTSENVDLTLSPWEKWLLNNELQERHNIIHPAILKMRSMSSLEKAKMKSERVTTVDGSVRHDLYSFSMVYKLIIFEIVCQNSVQDSLFSLFRVSLTHFVNRDIHQWWDHGPHFKIRILLLKSPWCRADSTTTELYRKNGLFTIKRKIML